MNSLIINYLVYILFFIAIFISEPVLMKLKRDNLCPCFVKVPMTLIVLIFAVYNGIVGNRELGMWITFLVILMIGNILVGNLSEKLDWALLAGQIAHVVSFLVAIIILFIFFGLPEIITILVFTSIFFGIIIISIINFNINVFKNWKEYIYMLIVIFAVAMTFQSDVNYFIRVSFVFLFYSEYLLHLSRISEMMYNEVAYDAAQIYLIGIVLLQVPLQIIGV